MPLPFIRSLADKKRWQQAIELTKNRKARRNPESPDYDPKLQPINNVFAYANWLYHNVLRGGSALVQEGEQAGLINNEEEYQLWENIEKRLFDDKANDTIEESRKWEMVEHLYSSYLEKHKQYDVQKLDEFVSTDSGYVPGNNNIAGLYGFGGYRDEPPRGPIIYGVNGTGFNNAKFKTNGDPAVVIVPNKKSQYDPEAVKMDTLGNVVSDVETAQKSSAIDDTIEGPTGDIFGMLQDIGYSADALEEMTPEELQHAMIKALKAHKKEQESSNVEAGVQKGKTIAQKLTEAFIYEDEDEELDEREGPLSKARRILAAKHRIKKAVERDRSRKYFLNQDSIEKLISKYGYRWNADKKIWVKKTNPTFLGRKLLADKFKETHALTKDKDNNYVVPQSEIIKKLSDHGYSWDREKRQWLRPIPGPTSYKPPAVAKPETPDKKPDEPMVSVVPKPPTEEPEESPKKKPIENDVPDEEEDDNKPIINPLYSPANVPKLKAMEARFIMGLAHNKNEMTVFHKNEEGHEIPNVEDADVLNKITMLGYEWHPDKMMWLDHTMSLPKAVFDMNENSKSIIARGWLASQGKVNNIKINESGHPSTDPEKLDMKMEHEGFIWIPATQRWKFLSEDAEITETLNESVELDEAPEEKFVDPKRTYSVVDVGEAQAKMLFRALQLEWFRKKYGNQPTNAQLTAWKKFQDGGDNDPVNGKLNIGNVEKGLEKMGYEFNDNEEEPMWVKSGEEDVPGVLKLHGMSKEEYIARGILGAKDPKQISIRSQNGLNPDFNEPAKKVIRRIQDSGLNWNEDYGWIKADNSGKKILSKNEKEHEDWIKNNEHLPYGAMSNKDKKEYKERSGYRLAARHIGVSPKDWNNLAPADKKKAMNKLQRNYEFDEKAKTWKQREKPLGSGFMSKLGSVLGSLAKTGALAAYYGAGTAFNIGKAIATDPALQYGSQAKPVAKPSDLVPNKLKENVEELDEISAVADLQDKAEWNDTTYDESILKSKPIYSFEFQFKELGPVEIGLYKSQVEYLFINMKNKDKIARIEYRKINVMQNGKILRGVECDYQVSIVGNYRGKGFGYMMYDTIIRHNTGNPGMWGSDTKLSTVNMGIWKKLIDKYPHEYIISVISTSPLWIPITDTENIKKYKLEHYVQKIKEQPDIVWEEPYDKERIRILLKV